MRAGILESRRSDRACTLSTPAPGLTPNSKWGGFDEVILWHDRDNYAVFDITEHLKRLGWKYCYTGMGRWGDQAIFTQEGAPVRISMDLTYYSKRRLRILPEWSNRARRCKPISGNGSHAIVDDYRPRLRPRAALHIASPPRSTRAEV